MGDIFTRIQYTLSQVKKKEEENNKKIERENKKREMARQIKEQIEKIKSIDAPVTSKSNDDEIPTWVKLVQDPEARKKFKQQDSLEDWVYKPIESKKEEKTE